MGNAQNVGVAYQSFFGVGVGGIVCVLTQLFLKLVFRQNLEIALSPLFSSSIHKHVSEFCWQSFTELVFPILVQQCTICSLTEAFLPAFAISYRNALIARPNI